jgi:hypothetical protein
MNMEERIIKKQNLKNDGRGKEGIKTKVRTNEETLETRRDRKGQ